MKRFAEIILPLPIRGTFTYFIPEEMAQEVQTGSRVYVQFGKRKYYTGIVEAIHTSEPKGYEVKPIIAVLDSNPIIKYPQLKLWNWMAEYYLCSIGDVFKAALPSGLKIESETFVSLNDDADLSEIKLTESQANIILLLKESPRKSLNEIEKETGIKNPISVIRGLLDLNILEISEKRKERYRPHVETIVRLNAERFDQNAIRDFFSQLSRSANQQRLLMTYLNLSDWNLRNRELKDVIKKDLITKADVSPAVYKGLEEKKILITEKKVFNRFKDTFGFKESKLSELSSPQKKAYNEIIESFREQSTVLLHGVTGSGKTEIYATLIDHVLNSGKQVLYLVPEISLTTHLTDRLRKLLGDRLLIYHSKFSDNERVDIWNQLLNTNKPLIVLGARSSVFLPFSNLGLIIVDEEHESSFKQYDPAPRYNARDTAIFLASLHGAKTLLGSATPSIETYYKATNNKYGLVSLTERFGDGQLPSVEIIDMPRLRKKHEVKGILSLPLLKETRHAIDEGNQAIIFQNRRGFAPVVICKECGWSPKCINCDVSLIYHKNQSMLKCHYCGYSIPLPSLCPACGLNGIEVYGYGTQRVAEALHDNIPEAKISRMDLDTTRNKDSMQKILEDFGEMKSNLLVGTQMITKGLDFKRVRIVGVVNADTLLNFPDFRSDERAFNMLEQVAGRAGRNDDKGKVMIQTGKPDSDVLRFVKKHDYQSYYNQQIKDREHFGYPPFTRIINIVIKHKDKRGVIDISNLFAKQMREVFGKRVLGPETPFVGRISLFYLQNIMLKIENGVSMKKVKEILHQLESRLASDPRSKGALIQYDVDPA